MMNIKKIIDRDNWICAILNQAAEECCLPTFTFCMSMVSITNINHSVINGGLHVGGHTINITAYIPEKGKWNNEIEVVVDAEKQIVRTPLTQIIDTLQELKDKITASIVS